LGGVDERFDFVVGADGAKSVVRRDLLGPLPAEFLSATVGYFLEGRRQEATTWFMDRPGYVWAFPRSDHLCLGGGSSDPDFDVWEAVETIRAEHFADWPVRQKWSAPIPFVRDSAFFDLPTTGPGWAVIGDAAGHVDALTGEGILYAMWGGRLLAGALLAQRPGDYEKTWRRSFGRELAKTADLSRRFYRPESITRVFDVAARSATMRRFLMDMMTDQPSYLKTGNMFLWRLPKIGLELVSHYLKA